MRLKVGERLTSPAGATMFVVLKAAPIEVEILCGGTALGAGPVNAPAPGSVPGGGSVVRAGKRYVDDALGIELLCAKGGPGPLVVNGVELRQKDAALLPASD